MRPRVLAAALAAALAGCMGYDPATNATTGTDRPGPTGFSGVTGFPIKGWAEMDHDLVLAERQAQGPRPTRWAPVRFGLPRNL